MTTKAKRTAAYVGVIAGCYGISMVIGLSRPAKRVNNIFYDWMVSRQPEEPWTPRSVVVAIDEPTLGKRGGIRNLRAILAEAVSEINSAGPAAVAGDVLLADETGDVEGNRALETALRGTKNLVLPCDLITINRQAKWEDPLPRFAGADVALGHVYRDPTDGVNRMAPLEEIADGKRRWALALQAFSLMHGETVPTETPDEVDTGGVTIPAGRSNGRLMYIRYLPAGRIPQISALEIGQNRDRIRGKAVFVGVTAVAANDRAATPFDREIPGVELHAQIYETIARNRFLEPVRDDVEFLLCILFAAAAGLIFGLRSGWQAYLFAGIVLALALWTPIQFFSHDRVFPFFEPVSVAWLSVGGAAAFQYFFVQRAAADLGV